MKKNHLESYKLMLNFQSHTTIAILNDAFSFKFALLDFIEIFSEKFLGHLHLIQECNTKFVDKNDL